jgi:hypothetical protein
MKINPTVAVTLFLLSLMVGAGIFSGTWGYTLGRQALKGITQPDIRPGANIGETEPIPARREQVVILREEDILVDVKARIAGQADETVPANPGGPQTKALIEQPIDTAPLQPNEQVGLPIATQSQGVTLQVLALRQQEDQFILEVSLQNQGDRPYRFSYSFIDIVDDQGQLLDGSTQGLPEEVPPTGEVFSGTIAVSATSLGSSSRLSLALVDYPDQQLKLQVSGIPVVR